MAEVEFPGREEIFAGGTLEVKPDRPFPHQYWDRLNDEQLGVDVVDLDGNEIGTASAVRETIFGIDIGKWTPVDGKKHVLVGELDHYSFYNPWSSGDEADFNLFVFPNPPFQFLLTQVSSAMSAEERKELHKRKRGAGNTMECEITPDEDYYDNKHFPTNGDPSPLVGRQVGAYGPWVKDMGHGGRPEIHPSEAIWWKSGNAEQLGTSGHVFWSILILQDDSNRYDRRGNYDRDLPRPWSAWPRRARVTIALIAPRGQDITYNVRMRNGRHVFDWPGENRRSRTVETAGTRLTVTKRMSRLTEVKMRVSELSPDPNDSRLLRSFLTLDIQVGAGDRGQEGFAEIAVTATAPSLVRSGAEDDDDDGPGAIRTRVGRPLDDGQFDR